MESKFGAIVEIHHQVEVALVINHNSNQTDNNKTQQKYIASYVANTMNLKIVIQTL